MTFLDLTDSIVIFANQYIIPLLYAIAFLVFMVGMVRYFFSEGDENREKGRSFVLWGIIGLAVIFSTWSLVRVFLSFFSYNL